MESRGRLASLSGGIGIGIGMALAEVGAVGVTCDTV